MSYIIHSFYQFFDFPRFRDWKSPLLSSMQQHAVLGTLLLAPEGINGTVSGTDGGLSILHQLLQTIPQLAPLEIKISHHESLPFGTAKVKLKDELISLGEPAHPQHQVGRYVSPQDWNALISDPEVIVIDARNSYEAHLGSFSGAINPQTRKFSQLPAATRARTSPQQHRKIASFCTGGIRCEKYTAWLLAEGYDEVYHLQGGILNYLETIPPELSLWQGSCYVFDERVAVGHGLQPDNSITTCPACGHPLTTQDRAHAEYVADVSCPHCAHYPPSNA
ncbi:MAG: rhodanese-related sulfurtransferase [Rickettsiales bacterium]|nr:rhodanese-related sulfurtransferase [Rickettsiales bacterium]